MTILTPLLPAVAKDIPKNTPSPSPSPGQPAVTPSEEIIKGLAGIAVSSGSFIIGVACGLIVVVGILKAQGK